MTAPFIKKIKQENAFYIYDVNTNQIIEVEESIYDLIELYQEDAVMNLPTLPPGLSLKYTPNQIADTFNEITRARQHHGLFSSFRPTRVLMGADTAEQLRELHKGNMQQLILELTTGCNLRCAYCPTAGPYAKNTGPALAMSVELCLRAVDFFYENSIHTENPYISFYGGEPLLHMDKIREVVSYIQEKPAASKYHFNVTTNGTLLNPGIVDFFIQHDFSITLSLDGPDHIHDRYRRTYTGESSFDTIIKNLQFMQARNPGYFAEKLAISCVLAPPYQEIEKTVAFFATEPIFAPLRAKGKIRASIVNINETDFLEKLDLCQAIKEYTQVSELFMQRFKAAILAGELSTLTLERRLMDSYLNSISRRVIKKLPEYLPHHGTCHIGLKRLYVKTNGDFFVCERSDQDYQIGNINRGFDFEQIASYYRQLEEVLADCNQCWALCHCERCWVQLGNLDKWSAERKQNFCTVKKREIEKAFKIYTELLQTNPECLRVFALKP